MYKYKPSATCLACCYPEWAHGGAMFGDTKTLEEFLNIKKTEWRKFCSESRFQLRDAMSNMFTSAGGKEEYAKRWWTQRYYSWNVNEDWLEQFGMSTQDWDEDGGR